jgi:hypothetical protein
MRRGGPAWAACDSPDMIDSNHGNATAAPVPRNKVRREIRWFLPIV